MKKPSVPKCLEGFRRPEFCELYQLFSSFLRGASRPKSPRDAVLTATSFMLERHVIVKPKLAAGVAQQRFARFLRQT
jgi:hypothetical protein